MDVSLIFLFSFKQYSNRSEKFLTEILLFPHDAEERYEF